MLLLIASLFLSAEAEKPGSLPKEEIAKVVKAHSAETKACFEMELEENPKAGGKVSLRFVINPDGAVGSVKVDSSTMSGSMNGCLSGKAQTWKFPAPPGGGKVEVVYPFVFKAS